MPPVHLHTIKQLSSQCTYSSTQSFTYSGSQLIFVLISNNPVILIPHYVNGEISAELPGLCVIVIKSEDVYGGDNLTTSNFQLLLHCGAAWQQLKCL